MKKLLLVTTFLCCLPVLIFSQNDNSGTYVNQWGQKIIVKEGDGGIFVTDGNQMNLFMTVGDDVYMNPFIGMTVLVYDDYIMFGNTNGQMFMYQKLIDYSALAMEARSQALELFQQGEWDDAITEYQNAISNENESPSANYLMLASDYQGIAACNMGILMSGMSVDDDYNYVMGDTGPVVDNMNMAAEYFRKAGDKKSEALSYVSIAEFYKNLFDYSNAVVYYKKAADIYKNSDQQEYAVQVSTIAGCYNQMNDWESAEKYLNIGLGIFENNIQTREDELNYASGLSFIGGVYVKLGRYDDAIKYFENSLDIAKKYSSIPLMVNYNQNMANVYAEMGQFEHAMKSLDEAKRLVATDSENDTEGVLTNIDVGMAHIFMSVGKWDLAEKNLESALNFFEESGDSNSIVLALIDLSSVHCEKKNYDLAQERINTALDICKDEASANFKNSNPDSVLNYVKLSGRGILQAAYVQYLKGNYPKALDHISGSIKMNERYNERPALVASYSLLGMIYHKMDDYQNTVESFDKSISLAKDIRKSVLNPKSQRDYLETMMSNYRKLTLVHYRNHKLAEAFNTTEISSATIFAEQIAKKLGMNELTYINLDSYKNQLSEKTLILNYQFIENDTSLCLYIEKNSLGAFEFSPQKLVDETYQKLGTQIARFEAPEMELRGMTSSQTFTEAGHLQSTNTSLKGKFDAIIKYYRFLMTGQDSETRGFKDLNEPEKKEIPGDFQVLSKILYKYLIKPIEGKLSTKNELVILPDGILGFLPFETFISPDNKFLCQKYNIRYQQSLAVTNMILQRETVTNGPILAVGGADYSQKTEQNLTASRSALDIRREGFSALTSGGEELTGFYNQFLWAELPGTLKEAQDIAQMQAGSKLLTGKEASESSINNMNASRDLENYRFIHFATHGLVVPEVPELSALVLSPGADSKNDGYMNMNDIYNLNLKAELVNLSACETGLGKIYSGEGVVGLTQSFLLAGAQGVSVSLWSVEDQGTSLFMTGMYSKIFDDNLDAVKAMNITKNEFIAGKYGELYKSPLFWAPFVYYGATDNDKIQSLKMKVADLKSQVQTSDIAFNIGYNLMSMGDLSAKQHEPANATLYYNQAIDAFNALYLKDKNNDAYHNVGMVYLKMADLNDQSYQSAKALDYYKKSKVVFDNLLSGTNNQDYNRFCSFLDYKINDLSKTYEDKISESQKNISILETIISHGANQAKLSSESYGDGDSEDKNRLLGIWTTTLNNYRPPVKITWCILEDGGSCYFWKHETGTQFTKGSYTLSKKTISETYEDGRSGEGKINWISNDQFELTIINNGNDSDIGTIRKYTRKMDQNFEDENDAIGRDYGNLSWYFLLTREFVKAEAAARKSVSFGDKSEWANTNLAHALLFQGKYEQAKKLYLDFQGKKYPLDETKKYKYYFLKDFDRFDAIGITHPDVVKIRNVLNNSF